VVTRDVVRWPGEEPASDEVAAEEPLEIRVEGQSLAVTMRTPGDDLDLAAGFLYTEGVIDGSDDLAALAHVTSPLDPRENTVDCRLAAGVAAHREALERARREIYATSSCGICGKASIDRLHVHAPPIVGAREPDPALLVALPGKLVSAQSGFARTGGLHAAALVTTDGTVEVVREDVGRHNAVDKVLGWRLRQNRVPVDDRILLVSSRAGFEIVQKALVARVPVVAVLGAATSLAVDLAAASGILLYGFVKSDRFVRYAPRP
jgi:FdhD protein